MKLSTLTLCFVCALLVLQLQMIPVFPAAADHEASTSSSIIFATLGRLDYAFDIFTLPVPTQSSSPSTTNELQITDGVSVNFNGHFPSSPPPSSLLSPTPNQTLLVQLQTSQNPQIQLVYVTERNGSSNIYYDAIYYDAPSTIGSRSSGLEAPVRVQVPLLSISSSAKRGGKTGRVSVSMKDRPSLVGDYLVYVSTHEDSGLPRTSWTAVYSTHLGTGATRRLTPHGVADYSPAVSPSRVWTAVASYGKRGWDGEVEELGTDIYIFLTRDGTQRVKVVEHGGWPCWVDDSTIYFHRRGDDNDIDDWWSIYRAILPSEKSTISTGSVVIQRVTPPGLHAFTPATSPGNHDFIAMATRRPGSSYRHIELFDLVNNEFKELTRLVSPQTHHLNPFISPDSARVGYHKCRGRKSPHLFLENLRIPEEEEEPNSNNLSIFRIDGSFPSFSPAGDRIAYVNFPGVYVANRDGSNQRQVYPKTAFSTAWDPVRKGVVHTSTGPTFATESTEVDVISINVDDVDQRSYKKLTTNGKNNAFPSPSPDGKWVVFRSGRSGYKNLYIMDAVEGERGGLRRLTEGRWTDTMCNWSPDGNWIAFASDRENPGTGSFELYVVHPNGTGLRKLVQSGSAGRTNHPWFSPDGKSIVFTSDYSAVSAEPISNPHHYQPYGEIYTITLDGSDLKRLTHNSYEDGTPAWGPTYIRPADVEWPNYYGSHCSFEDLHWLNNMQNDSVSFKTAPLASVSSSTSTTTPQCGLV